MQKIREVYQSLSSAKKSAASFFLNHYQDIPFMTVTELADVIGVSDTTIINLCADLGFEGFSGFKRAVRDEVQREQSAMPLPKDESVSEEEEIFEVLTSLVIENIRQTMNDRQNRTAITRAVELMCGAKRINTVGFWSFSAQASAFALQLRRDGYPAQAIYPSFGDYIDKVLQINRDEMVLMFDFARYISGLTEIALLLKEKGVPIVLITDMGPCPRHAYADIVVHCRVDSPMGKIGSAAVKVVTDTMRLLLKKKSPAVHREYDAIREGVFTRFNQYGVVEPDARYTDRV